jgi:hypothetical protein
VCGEFLIAGLYGLSRKEVLLVEPLFDSPFD